MCPIIDFHLSLPLTSFFSFTNNHSLYQQFVKLFVKIFVFLALLVSYYKVYVLNYNIPKISLLSCIKEL